MPKALNTFLKVAALTLVGAASALPALPAQTTIASAVQQAMAPAAAPVVASTNAASSVADGTYAVNRTGRSVIARATAYNSLGGQTDGTPHITATGTRTRPGVVALSRDLLRVFPYGTRIQIQDLSGRYNFGNQVFIVEDTMAARKVGSIDIWLPSYSQAIAFGARQVRITAVR